MARLFFAWELGAGSGHIVPYRKFFEGLTGRGHEVTVALKEAATAKRLSALPITCVHAPWSGTAPEDLEPFIGWGQILNNFGWGDDATLRTLHRSWEWLLERVAPDVMLANHSPTALLAARTLGVPCVVGGASFCVPPEGALLPWLRPGEPAAEKRARETEAKVLARANAVTRGRPLGRLSDLWHDGTEVRITTFAELDVFGHRSRETFIGVSPPAPGPPATWPKAPGPKVFAYLKQGGNPKPVLAALAELRLPTIAVIDGMGPEEARKFATPAMNIRTSGIDIHVALEAACGVLNGNNTTTAQFLQAGKPIVIIPWHMEHKLTGHRVIELGCGIIPRPDPAGIVSAVQLAVGGHFAEGTSAFAKAHPLDMEDRFTPALEDVFRRWLP